MDFVKSDGRLDGDTGVEMPTSHAELKGYLAMPGDISKFAEGEFAEPSDGASKQAPGEARRWKVATSISISILVTLWQREVAEPKSRWPRTKRLGILSALEFDLDIAEDESRRAMKRSSAESACRDPCRCGSTAEMEAEEASSRDSAGLDFDLDTGRSSLRTNWLRTPTFASTVSVSPVDALDNDDVAMVDLEKSSFDGTLLDFDFEPESSALTCLPTDHARSFWIDLDSGST